MLVWVLSTATVSRYKVIKVMARGLRFGITCVKSDKFRSKAPENQSEPPFSETAPPNEKGTKGPHPPEGGLSAGAGSRGEKWPGSRHNKPSSWGPGALSEEN